VTMGANLNTVDRTVPRGNRSPAERTSGN
jgi:hypothetical protein